MPVYQYRCSECQTVAEVLLPMQDRDRVRNCDCGGTLGRLITTPAFVVINIMGRNKILNTLNGEHGKGVRSKRSTMALARGLNYQRPVIGRGFG